MATQKKGKRQKGKTLQLNAFLGEGAPNPIDGKKVVTLKASSWADEVEDNEDSYPIQTEQVALPQAPRAARQEIDISQLPDSPPYTTYVGNLSYDADEESLCEYFRNMKLNVISARLVRESGRMKGYGYVEFGDKQSLASALRSDGETYMNRKLKVDLSTPKGRDGGFGSDRDGRGGERSQITGEGDADDDWRTTAASSAETSSYGRDGGFRKNDRDGGFGRQDRDGGFGRNRDERDGSFGTSRDRYAGPSEADTADSWSRGPPRIASQDDRSGGYGSRQGYDNRDSSFSSRNYNDRDSGYNRPSYDERDSSFGRRSFNDRDSDYGRRGYDERDSAYGRRGHEDRDSGYSRRGYDDRDSGYGRRDSRYDERSSGYDRQASAEGPKERPKLQLAPRSKPADSEKSAASKPAAPSVFGSAKPVDTAAKEREIEERLRRQQEDRSGRDRDSGSSFASRDIRTNVERQVYNEQPASDRSQPNGHPEQQASSVKKPTAAAIFGEAKPVDTGSREREIEERLRKERPIESRDSAPADRKYDNRDRDYQREAPRANAWSKGPPASRPGERPRKEQRERPLPKSLDEMPQYKEREGQDFAVQNKYAGLLGSDGDDDAGD
ncbi:eukaryotic translation initiation factor 4B-like isoform X2 [Watersipora subatra]|uniref:eukaryotic translation initiation factor 4B-like isoform X2 n=1 Tax=Watersipora subatra TaxID=2589382 RepID=UPI00355B2DF5